MALGEYRRKRRFDRTPEPAGAPATRRGARRPLFVIQKHAARRLHYDFRLEHHGALKSWAIPKGPSLDPKERRLAVEVEDHPLEYGDFEGVIPEGEYGGGTVLLWDRGWWQPKGDVADGLRRGRLKFELHGKKLRGAFDLVRLRRGGDDDKNTWLLIKERDTAARSQSAGDVLEERPESVASGRELPAIAAERQKVWRSGRRASRTRAAKSSSGVRRRLPAFVPPQLAALVAEAPSGAGWLHEIKLDGYRILASTAAGKARLFTRSGQDWTDRFPAIAKAVAELETESALIDGEVVALDASGRSSFQALQNALRDARRTSALVYFAFDLLQADGVDLRARPLHERKEHLAALLTPPRDGAALRFNDHVAGKGNEFYRHACRLGVEGIVAKRADAPYRSGRGRDWLKVKCTARQDFVIVGFTDPGGARKGLGALLLGVWDDGTLRFSGKVGTGFDAATLRELRRKLEPLVLARPPASLAAAPRGAAVRGLHWVEPRLVAEVSFSEWTDDGLLRHPSFEGLREDKPARQVRREAPVTTGNQHHEPANSAAPASIAGAKLSHPERVLYPEQNLTKLGLARYYQAVADWILPHLRQRLLTLVRCPEGRQRQCFFQKHLKDEPPAGIRSLVVREQGGASEPYLYVETLEGLVSLVQMGVLEIHGWGSLVKKLERPDRLVFDLDPDAGVPWAETARAARLLRDRLVAAGLRSFVQTTGGKGLHVIAPLAPRARWEAVKRFARALAEDMVATDPERFVSQASKAARRGKIFIDWLRNARGATAIVPYSTRARADATVATPLRWNELGRTRPADFNAVTVPRRLRALHDDPWSGFWSLDQTLDRGAAATNR